MSFFKASNTPSKQAVSRIPKCGACGLFKGCQSPKMKPSGKGRKGILIVGEAPGATEDERGVQFIGKAGNHLEHHLLDVGIDMRKDCWITNCIICRPPDNKIPSPKVIDYCRPTLFNTIEQLKPNIIICFGLTAVKSLIGHLWREDVGPMARWAGWRIPSQKPNAWICPTYHPSYLLRENNPVLELHFAKHLAAAAELQGKPWQKLPEYQKQVQVVENPTEAAALLRKLIKRKPPLVAFDYETDRLKPDSKEATIVTCAVSDGETTLSYPWHGEAVEATKELLTDPDIKKTAHNCLSGNTRFLTKEYGITSLEKMEGRQVHVLNHEGRWTKASIECFGEQETSTVTFGRRNHLISIRATDKHRWLLESKEERTTDELRLRGWRWVKGNPLPADTVSYLRSPKTVTNRKDYIEGIKHGIVLGDGTKPKKRKNYFWVRLCGEKAELLKYFKGHTVSYYPSYGGDPVVYLSRQLKNLKDVPPKDVSDSYLIGFFRGLLATDGCVAKNGQIHISNSKKVIRWCVKHMPRIGYWFQCKVHANDYDDGTLDENGFRLVQDNWCVYLSRESIQFEDLLRKKHRKNYKPIDRGPFKLHSIGADRRIEKVYCAVVPDGESFVLEGGLLTGNCKFEHRWSKAVLGIEVKPWAYCSMVGSHVLDNRRGITGLKFQAYVRFGQPSYNDYIEPYLKQKNSNQPNKIWDADFQKLLLYGALDAKLQYELAVLQMKEMQC